MQLEAINELVKALRKDATTQGISIPTGLNFYYLEQTAKSVYPVFYPLLASVPRDQARFNGQVVGGTGVNWKAIISIDTGGATPGYPFLSEGNRNAFMEFQEKDYFAAYKFIGKDTEVSFQAQQTGLGFDDNVGLAQVALLNALLNDEERAILYGNSGSAGNGFQLGQCPTPTVTITASSGSGMSSSVTPSAFCVALTGWGVFFATATGVQLPFNRTNADGSTDLINGGTSAISAVGTAGSQTSGGNLWATATVTAVAGAMGYAWYLNTTDTSTGNAYFVSVTSAPTTIFKANPVTTNQKASAPQLATDNSANAVEFDGLTTWGFNYASAAKPSYWLDLGGANLTANGDGTIAEFEAVMDFFWLKYKITPDKIWLGGTLMDPVSKKILGGGVSNAVTRVFFEQDSAGKVVGGTFAVAYRSKYGPGQTKQLDVQTHPWLPQGVILFDLINNPYPAAGNSIPAVRRMMTLEDHFSIKWPYRKLEHEVGVYCFLTMQHYIPFGIGLLTGVGSS